MGENYSTAMLASLLMALIGIWLLINAMIDISARYIRHRLGLDDRNGDRSLTLTSPASSADIGRKSPDS